MIIDGKTLTSTKRIQTNGRLHNTYVTPDNKFAYMGSTRTNILTVPVWADAKLTQLGPNGWSIYKRTSPDSSWLHVTDGHRAQGLAVLADVSGGLAVGGVLGNGSPIAFC